MYCVAYIFFFIEILSSLFQRQGLIIRPYQILDSIRSRYYYWNLTFNIYDDAQNMN